jgi:hypothetical protein
MIDLRFVRLKDDHDPRSAATSAEHRVNPSATEVAMAKGVATNGRATLGRP